MSTERRSSTGAACRAVERAGGEKIAIVGSRDYTPLDDVAIYVESLGADDHVISGGARGPDSEAEKVARRRGLAVTIFRPDWNSFGKAAGMVRNQFIVSACDRMVAFWDGTSRGTAHAMDLCRKAGKPLEIIR